MVRARAPTPSKRKEKEVAAASAEDKADEMENKRLRDLAFSRGLLSRTKSHAQHPSLPSKTILNSDGRDIVKKGHRKSKYLFAFPGLMAPVAGGKLGELTNLDSKNPVLYVDFPQGRLKLFGTIVYPKNKYLTLHFPRGAGNIVCEDCFESLVVFSIAWWIGTKEQNPEEVRIPLPKSFEQDKHADFDFTAGAGQAKDSNTTKHQKEKAEAASQPNLKPKPEVSEIESSDKDTEAQMANQPVRQSARMAGRKLKYADSSSDKENDSDGTDSVESQQILKTGRKKQLLATKEVSNKVDINAGGSSGTIILDSDVDTPGKKKAGTPAAERNLSSELVPAITTELKSFTAAAKTPPEGSSGKVSVLKQSRLEAFHQKSALQEEHTTIVIEASTPETNHKVTASVSKGSAKSAKRSRKTPKEDNTEGSCSEDSDNDLFVGKGTPSKGRKRVKSDEGGAGVNKGASAITPTTLHSKTILSPKKKRIEQTRSRKEKKSATETASKGGGSASKGRKSAVSRAAGVKPSKKSSDSEEELSKSNDMSDDSDEDWVG